MLLNRMMSIACIVCLCSCASEPDIDITSQSLGGSSSSSPPVPAASAGPEDADAPKEFTTTSSGLKYRILRKSEGRKPTANPQKSDTVQVHYVGWLDNGTEFDSSYKRGEPVEFSLNGVIKGWTEGLTYVGEGGMIELEIPSDLGYGPSGSGGTIPPNATLHFKVELIKIVGQ